MSKLLIVNGSPRKHGACSKISKMIADDVMKYDYETEIIDLESLNIHGCRACESCKKTGRCAQNDDMTQLYDKIRGSDMILLESPIYFGAETAQMKTFIDRFYAMTMNRDGQRLVNIGNVKKGAVLLTCGAPNGEMLYANVLARYAQILKSFGIIDYSGVLLAGIPAEEIETSEKVKDFIESIEFQIETGQ